MKRAMLRHYLVISNANRLPRLSGKLIRHISPEDFLKYSSFKRSNRIVIVSCGPHQYLSLGYHIAMVAEARGYSVFPSPDAMFCADSSTLGRDELDSLRLLLNPVTCSTKFGALSYRLSRTKNSSTRETPRPFKLLVLYRPADKMPASDFPSLLELQHEGKQRMVKVTLCPIHQFRDLHGFDGLFLRCPNAYRFALAATKISLPVLDDPKSILRCSNKIFATEVCRIRSIATPKSVIVQTSSFSEARMAIEAVLSYPLILKHPAQSYGRGVSKVDSPSKLKKEIRRLRKTTAMAIAQEFVPTEYDWRIGILDGAFLYGCRYYMARNSWKIINQTSKGRLAQGRCEFVSKSKVPDSVIVLAKDVVSSFGDGLYGVDIKLTGNGPIVMEVNDNPDIYSGIEATSPIVWRKILNWFVNRRFGQPLRHQAPE